MHESSRLLFGMGSLLLIAAINNMHVPIWLRTAAWLTLPISASCDLFANDATIVIFIVSTR